MVKLPLSSTATSPSEPYCKTPVELVALSVLATPCIPTRWLEVALTGDVKRLGGN
jgi:hypothetical protein